VLGKPGFTPGSAKPVPVVAGQKGRAHGHVGTGEVGRRGTVPAEHPPSLR